MSDSVELQQRQAGIALPVRVQPRARKNAVVGTHAGCLKVAVTQAPEKGKANEAIVKVLAASLNIRKQQITLIGGATSRQKTFLVSQIDLDQLRNRITNCLDGI